IERQIGEPERAAEQLARTAQQRSEARDELLESKRLDEIVVGAAAKTADAVVDTAASGEDEHRDRVLAPAQLAQQRQAVSVGGAETHTPAPLPPALGPPPAFVPGGGADGGLPPPLAVHWGGAAPFLLCLRRQNLSCPATSRSRHGTTAKRACKAGRETSTF